MRRVSQLFALLVAFAATPALADDPFTVKDVPVDASAASATEAQNIAINSGRPQAWNVLFHRLVPQSDWGKQPKLDDVALQRLIRTYLPNNERRSTTRYVARVTYVFNEDAVKRLFRSNNIAFVDTTSKPLLVVGMSPKYDAHSSWAAMFAHRNAGGINLVAPQGGGLDETALGSIDFGTVTWQTLGPVAQRVGASEAYLAQVSSGGGNITVKIRRLGPGFSPPMPDVVVPAAGGAKAYADAANATAAAIVNYWKQRSAIDFSQRSKLTADLRIDSLAQYGSVLQALASVSLITDVGIAAMNMGDARLVITYAGSPDQLRDALSQAHLQLAQRSGDWWLASTADLNMGTQ